jgi:hypothetical protein
MPPSLYCVKTGEKYNSKEEMLKLRRISDNKKQKIRYWRKNYNYDLKIDDYDEFNKIANVIRYVYKYHDFLVKYNPNEKQVFEKDDLDIYVKNHKFFKRAIPHLDYIKTLRKIESKVEHNEPIVITF